MILLRFYGKSRKICYFRLKRAVHRYMLDKRQVMFLSQPHIILPKRGRDMHDTSSFVCIYKISGIYFPPILTMFQFFIFCVIVKDRNIVRMGGKYMPEIL